MRPRASLTGPLVLIVVGVIFLMHAISPEFAIADLFLYYWPYLLILWGVIAFIEVTIRFARSGQIPANGVSGGGWVLVIFICLAGVAAYEMHRANPWWRQMGWERGVEAFGAEHEYAIDPQRK
ncbi:MAG: LiaF transmembrane domain-containing protein, partial [Bryobacteraceae bacterium]